MIKYNVVNALVRLMSGFNGSFLVQRNVLGCLFMLTREDVLGEGNQKTETKIIEEFRNYLGLPLLFKTIQSFLYSSQYCFLLIVFLQNLAKSTARPQGTEN